MDTQILAQNKIVFKVAPQDAPRPRYAMVNVRGVICAVPHAVLRDTTFQDDIEQARDMFVIAANALNGPPATRDNYEDTFKTLARAIERNYERETVLIQKYAVRKIAHGIAFYAEETE
jgi:hypothetical protein